MFEEKDDLGNGLQAYDPGEFLRPGSSENIAGGAEKHPTPTLRVFTETDNPWLMYGGFGGGEQDDDGKWLEIYYTGLVKRDMVDLGTGEVKRKLCFGRFILRIEGEKLEPLCDQLGKHLLPKLMIGTKERSMVPYRIDRITLTPYTPGPLDGADED